MEHSKYKDYMSMGFTHRNASILAAADGLTTEEAVARLSNTASFSELVSLLEANGVSIQEAVKYITHGPEMEAHIRMSRWEGAQEIAAKLNKEGA